jgi:hypothetical protein
MGETRNALKILVGKLEGSHYTKDVDRRIILKWILGN